MFSHNKLNDNMNKAIFESISATGGIFLLKDATGGLPFMG